MYACRTYLKKLGIAYTAFSVLGRRHFQFRRVAFGYTNAPATFILKIGTGTEKFIWTT